MVGIYASWPVLKYLSIDAGISHDGVDLSLGGGGKGEGEGWSFCEEGEGKCHCCWGGEGEGVNISLEFVHIIVFHKNWVPRFALLCISNGL